MDSFYCGLHAIVHFVETAVSAQLEFEKEHFDSGAAPVLNSACARAGQSGASRCIMALCKSFSAGGDEKNGCYA